MTYKKCNLEECDGDAGHYATARGLCLAHYQRLMRHGDARAGGTRRVAGRADCTVQGCPNKSNGKGLCAKHGNRLAKNGDVNVFQVPVNERVDWIRANSSHTGDECLIWPFTTGDHGRGSCRLDGQGMSAPRAMCIIAHGAPPTEAHQAAHSCGKGHEGCMSPGHLSWKTPTENEADKVEHGTLRKGTAINTNKLTESDVLEIRRATFKYGELLKLANKLGVTRNAIYAIRNRKTWAWLDDAA